MHTVMTRNSLCNVLMCAVKKLYCHNHNNHNLRLIKVVRTQLHIIVDTQRDRNRRGD